MQKKITIRDIARQCGTSISTVSRVINGTSGVKEELKKNILSAIQECNWESNNIQLKFSKKLQKQKLVIQISYSQTHSTLDFIFPTVHICDNSNFKGIYFFGYDDTTMELCKKLNPYAMILVASFGSFRDDIQELEKNGTRILYISDSDIQKHIGSSCYINIKTFMEYAVELLTKKGHTKIGYFGQFGDHTTYTTPKNHTPRQNDAVAALKKLLPDFSPANDTVGDCYNDLTSLKKCLQEKRITAWICENSYMGERVAEEAQKLNIRIPDELAVLSLSGFRNNTKTTTCIGIDHDMLETEIRNFLDAETYIPQHTALKPVLQNPDMTLKVL